MKRLPPYTYLDSCGYKNKQSKTRHTVNSTGLISSLYARKYIASYTTTQKQTSRPFMTSISRFTEGRFITISTVQASGAYNWIICRSHARSKGGQEQ